MKLHVLQDSCLTFQRWTHCSRSSALHQRILHRGYRGVLTKYIGVIPAQAWGCARLAFAWACGSGLELQALSSSGNKGPVDYGSHMELVWLGLVPVPSGNHIARLHLPGTQMLKRASGLFLRQSGPGFLGNKAGLCTASSGGADGGAGSFEAQCQGYGIGHAYMRKDDC